MQKTPAGLRKKIVFVGKVNVGKSSLINAIVGDQISIVSEVKGTTTDSISKAYEILGYGPVLLCDTAGFGDNTDLGVEREKASLMTLKNADLAILVIDSPHMDETDKQVLDLILKEHIPYIIINNKCDLYQYNNEYLSISTVNKKGIDLLLNEMVKKLSNQPDKHLLEGIVESAQRVLLVMPQDSSAPKGRLILPQVQMMRELLDKHVLVTAVQLQELKSALNWGPYDLVITDSKVIKEVLSIVPEKQKVSTFSVLFARSKGDFDTFLNGIKAIDHLQDGNTVLIAEACVHTTNEDDIAKAMLPKILQKKTGKKLNFEFFSGKKLPDDLSKYALILQCGGCMLTPKEMSVRIQEATKAQVPITNYGLTITKCQVGDIKRLTF